jgi:hypothetical protein
MPLGSPDHKFEAYPAPPVRPPKRRFRTAAEGHLDDWMREIADRRIHGTTGQAPMARFVREEAAAPASARQAAAVQ